MPTRVCAKCGKDFQFPLCDTDFHDTHMGECPLCWSVIAAGRYQKNIKDAVTLFSPMGNALGDGIMQEVVRRRYAADNPDEHIVNLGLVTPDDAIAQYRPTKFFWCDVTNFVLFPGVEKTTWFSLCNEAEEYARQGYYPELMFDVKPVEVPESYVVLSARNVNKAPMKNAEPVILNKILISLYNEYKDLKVVVVGNDFKDETVYYDPEYVIDMRFKLGLPEIAYVCQHSKLVIGKDSGILHLAAAAGANVVGWGYADLRWRPKAPPDRVKTIHKYDSTPGAVMDMVNDFLRGK